MTEEPKKNHWYEMYELECLQTKELEKQIERMKCCANCWRYYRDEIDEILDDLGHLCAYHAFNDKCKLWELAK